MRVGLQKAVSRLSSVRPPSGLPYSVSHSTTALCVYVFSFDERLRLVAPTVFCVLNSAASLTVAVSEMKEMEAVLSKL